MTLDFVPGPPGDPPAAPHQPRTLRWRLLRGVWAATFYYLLPAFGGLGAADLGYDLLGFSLTMSAVAGVVFASLAWRTVPPVPATSWAAYLRQAGVTTLYAASPMLAYAAVYWPLSHSTRFPALLPALFVSGLVFYLAVHLRPQPDPTPPPPRNRTLTGQAPGEGMRAVAEAISLEVRPKS